ncbi:MAG: magnesium/cobalt transporter CorA [Candidatus Lokiarchaeota archaeon]|nr:magnesium/cobalt transporter CorA [Candidatus Lokiarchaeota archaeon]
MNNNEKKKYLKKSKKVGLPPGSLVTNAEKKTEHTKIKIIDYDKESFNIENVLKIEKSIMNIGKGKIRWIIIDGITQVDIIKDVGNQFNLHSLVLEDILNTNQTPKFEDYGDYIFIVLKKLLWDKNKNKFETEQISIILGENYVIVIREQESTIFDPIIDRIIIPKGRVRLMGADYLAYTLIDIIIDNYFIVQEIVGESIEEIEDSLIEDPQSETLHSIYKLKRSTLELRKSIWPVREIINKLQREESQLISDNMHIYFRDIYDHIFRINDSLQNYREIISGMLDVYLSSISNKMNDIMKVLTIISTIFIPLSFIAGFYGMNFINMPEISSPFGYPLLILLMIMIAFIMVLYFLRKKWI